MITYDAALWLKLTEFGFKSHTLIKGDNFIAAVLIPASFIQSQGIDDVVDLIKQSLREACTFIGQAMNVIENCVSTTVAYFSMEYYIIHYLARDPTRRHPNYWLSL